MAPLIVTVLADIYRNDANNKNIQFLRNWWGKRLIPRSGKVLHQFRCPSCGARPWLINILWATHNSSAPIKGLKLIAPFNLANEVWTALLDCYAYEERDMALKYRVGRTAGLIHAISPTEKAFSYKAQFYRLHRSEIVIA